jgi:hypothetical protein
MEESITELMALGLEASGGCGLAFKISIRRSSTVMLSLRISVFIFKRSL